MDAELGQLKKMESLGVLGVATGTRRQTSVQAEEQDSAVLVS